MRQLRTALALGSLAGLVLGLTACGGAEDSTTPVTWETANPVQPLPTPPLGLADHVDFTKVGFEMTPEKVRLGRLLFFDGRLSKDGTISCATCHRPENAFSEPTPVSTGINGQKGGRKAPKFANLAWPLQPVYFWDGRAGSLKEQAGGPIANPIEMGETHEGVVAKLKGIEGYVKAFKAVYGTEEINIDRVTEAIAAYESTRLSGNSAYDRHAMGEGDLTGKALQGHDMFFGKPGVTDARCANCHFGFNFTDSKFHNLGIGWDEATQTFKDKGRYDQTNDDKDMGAFKTPGLRDVTKHAPYMHDGSLKTLREVMEHYNKGGNKNPHLSENMVPLNLTEDEIDALIAFMEALDGEGYMDTKPTVFP